MLTFAPPAEFVPQLTPLMQYQQTWWRDNFRLPSPPCRKLSAEQPLTYDEAESLRRWQKEADDVIHRYTAFVATEAGAKLISELDSSRQQSLKVIEAIDEQHFYRDGAPFVSFLKDTAHPSIGVLKIQARLLLAEYERELAARPSEETGIGEGGQTVEAVYRNHFAHRKEAIEAIEAMLSITYATHAEAVEMIAKAKAAVSAIRDIPRETIYPRLTGGYSTDETQAELDRYRRQYAY